MLERSFTLYMRYATSRHMHFALGQEKLAPKSDPMKADLLYLHIPFCEALCPYCSFHRVLLKRPQADRFFDALRREILSYRDKGFCFEDVYVGGGTPTAIPEQLVETLELIRSIFPIKRISVETNPNHLDARTLQMLQRAGVDRLSVGVQSFDDQLLQEMERYGRYGSGEEIEDRLRNARGKFKTLSVDMIFNLPHQTPESLERDIDTLTKQPIADQISYYPLMGAETTSEAMRKHMGRLSFDRERSYYERILAGLLPTYQLRTPWSFSLQEGLLDEYIVDHGNYIGLGSGAFSYVDGTFYSSSFSINRYIDQINNGHSGIVMSRKLGYYEQLRYEFMIRLFGLELDWTEMREAFPSAIPPMWAERKTLELLGIIRREGTYYRLTQKGMYFWLVIMREFLTGVNNFRAEARAHIRVEPSSGRP